MFFVVGVGCPLEQVLRVLIDKRYGFSYSWSLSQKLGMCLCCMLLSLAPIDCSRLGKFDGTNWGCILFS